MRPDPVAHRHVGEHLGHELGIRAGHHRVGGRDDEPLEPGEGGIQRPLDGLRTVSRVDVTPEVPLAQGRIRIESRKLGVVLGDHDVREAQRRDRQGRVPPHELGRQLLLEVLDQGVDRLRTGRVLLVDGNVRGWGVEGQSQHGLTGRVHDATDAETMRRPEHIERGGHVVVEGRDITADAGSRDRGEVHERIDTIVLVVHSGDGVDHLAVVAQVDLDEAGSALAVLIEVDHVVAGRAEFGHDHPSELAGATCHCNAHEPTLALLPTDSGAAGQFR